MSQGLGKHYQPWPLVQLITLTGTPTIFAPDITKLFIISFQRPVLVILDRNMDHVTRNASAAHNNEA